MKQEHQCKPYLEYYDAKEQMLRVPFRSPGYHSRVPDGTWVHPTNPSLCYALELVGQGNREADRRAAGIIKKVLALQDCNPLSKTYGIWPWLLEEPLTAMSPPDWNWADFCGFRLAAILIKSGKRLPVTLRDAMREALFHAAGAIYRRNVGTHYTNICVMGGIVTVLAGEILLDKRLLDYGRRRLAAVVAEHRRTGGFNEYNSPTYTKVVLWDCEQALGYIKDPQASGSVRYLFYHAWKIVADHFHPATGQWAGPHSRDYHLFMTREFSRWLAVKTGTGIRTHREAAAASNVAALVGWNETVPDGEACPREFRQRFRRLPRTQYQFSEKYAASICGTTWLHRDACLGSVNRDFFMDQRRAMLAYWNNEEGQPVALRLRFMHDGREFSSACVCNSQAGARVLSAVHLLLGLGDFHPELDRPVDNTFYARDFRLRYELRGEGLKVSARCDGSLLLAAGDWEAVVTPANSQFCGKPVQWQIERGDGWVAVDAVCYHGVRKKFAFAKLPPVVLAAGLRLQKKGTKTDENMVQVNRRADGVHYRYGKLQVTTPGLATPF